MTVAIMLPRVEGSVFTDRAAASVMGAAHSLGDISQAFVLEGYGDLDALVPHITVLEGTRLEEDLAMYMADMWSRKGWDAIVLPATLWGRALAPRIAAFMDVPVVSDITGVFSETKFMRITHAGRIATTLSVSAGPKVVTVRPSAFEPPAVDDTLKSVVERITVEQNSSISLSLADSMQGGSSLISADVVLVVGRGMASVSGLKKAEEFSEVTQAALGATRATCDLGILPGDRQVGQTGKIIAPKVYLGVGVSGAVQHVAGIKDAGFIAVINSDPDAPILQSCDLGLVSRWEDSMDVVIKEVKER